MNGPIQENVSSTYLGGQQMFPILEHKINNNKEASEIKFEKLDARVSKLEDYYNDNQKWWFLFYGVLISEAFNLITTKLLNNLYDR